MDSNAVLDFALFQLTPTRTRCELVVFSGGAREKIASGLFDPFLSHLKFAKDEISKGGYSIKLLPPTVPALWFTKATFERFVRFVSTPAILERFVTIEKEILQTENSYEVNKLSMSNAILDEGIVPQSNGNARRLSDSSKLNGELEGFENEEEENSKLYWDNIGTCGNTNTRNIIKTRGTIRTRGIISATGSRIDYFN